MGQSPGAQINSPPPDGVIIRTTAGTMHWFPAVEDDDNKSADARLLSFVGAFGGVAWLQRREPIFHAPPLIFLFVSYYTADSFVDCV